MKLGNKFGTNHDYFFQKTKFNVVCL